MTEIAACSWNGICDELCRKLFYSFSINVHLQLMKFYQNKSAACVFCVQ